MSWYKDQWNERYYERFEEVKEAGGCDIQADLEATAHAETLIEDLQDQADILRKRMREERT